VPDTWLPAFEWSELRFGAPVYLWLLVVPAGLVLLWAWQLRTRIEQVRFVRHRRRVPVAGRLSRAGDLLFWLCLVLALSAAIVALARPRTVVGVIRTTGVDLIVLQDGSASMHVRDAAGVARAGQAMGRPDRWQRAMAFLRELGESLRWENDRIALALFAHIATPQIRLTKDPNTFFFFLDHLDTRSPFRIEDDTSWDTNIERGIYWGLRLMEKDEELNGASRNAQAFVLISDGQAWSGQVATSLALARARGVPIHVIGVGTTAGGVIPDPGAKDAGRAPIRSSLDRNSLSLIASAGGGRYFELDGESDREIATAIVDLTRRSGTAAELQEATEELYWQLLLVAVVLAGIGVLFLRERVQLALHLTATVAALMLIGVLAA
jgi:Ca-activated chloride channel family protein